MSFILKVGRKSVSPKRAKDSRGQQGVFLTEKEWETIVKELNYQKTDSKKVSLLTGSLLAINEVEQHLRGKKKLRNAKEAISEL